MAKQTVKKSTTRTTTARKADTQPADASQTHDHTAGRIGALPTAAPVSAPKAALTRPATFLVIEPHAQRVFLSGEFNNWSTDQMPLRRDQQGHWEATIDLKPGRYQYKFVVDGQWIPDPLATEYVYNQHGTLNSIIDVRA
jgi:1,4-alpha-glucan branching enzyme